jgi:hypothetical protein
LEFIGFYKQPGVKSLQVQAKESLCFSGGLTVTSGKHPEEVQDFVSISEKFWLKGFAVIFVIFVTTGTISSLPSRDVFCERACFCKMLP